MNNAVKTLRIVRPSCTWMPARIEIALIVLTRNNVIIAISLGRNAGMIESASSAADSES